MGLVQLNEATQAGKRGLRKLLSATRHLAVAIREQGRHQRYRGPGVTIYWHVEKKSLCVYSQLKSCSASGW
ncbi:hypothetical protein EAO68_02060 [Streptomyces sp. wa22]|nr:hypothetical protein EAO68_02060 [Streptomyces sp. wa22]